MIKLRDCPSLVKLRMYLERKLLPDQHAKIFSHIQSCDHCADMAFDELRQIREPSMTWWNTLTVEEQEDCFDQWNPIDNPGMTEV